MSRTSSQAAADEAARRKRERLEESRTRMLADIRHRPEDSSPAIRRLLGYDRPRPPREGDD